jgi:hypothetical protein
MRNPHATMSHAIPTKKRPIHLKYDAGKVVVTPEDEDRFVMASQQAVAACQNVLAFDRFVSQFREDFLTRLRAWCEEHSAHVRSCFVPFSLGGKCIKVFVVSEAARFDFDLSDSIADLEMKLADDGWPCDILQIAAGEPEELQVFFDPEESIQVYE